MFEPVWLNLQGIRINLFFPKPVRAAELDIIRIQRRDFFELLKKLSSWGAVFKTKGNVGNPVLHSINGVCLRQWFQVMSVILTSINKMPIAALQGEAVRKFIHAVNEISYGSINDAVMKVREIYFSLFLIKRVFSQLFRFYISFQVPLSFLDFIL
jgi:hypothetical protein